MCKVIQRFVCYFPSPSACTQYQHTHTHTHTYTHTHTQFLFKTDPGTQDQVWYVSKFYHRDYSSSTIFRYRGLENSVTAPIELSYKCGTFQFAYVYAMHNVSREV